MILLLDMELDLDLEVLVSFLGRERSQETEPAAAALDISASEAETPPSLGVRLGLAGNGDFLRSLLGVCGMVMSGGIGEASAGDETPAEGVEMEWLLFRPNILRLLPIRPLSFSVLLSPALSAPAVAGLFTSTDTRGVVVLLPNSSNEFG